jgi:phosphotriesterase-related protein
VIQTVTGPVQDSALGVTLAHEHMLIDLRCLYEPSTVSDGPDLADSRIGSVPRDLLQEEPYRCKDNLVLDDESDARSELRDFHAAGGNTIIDLTVDGIGPDPAALRRLSEQSGVQIVAGTGVYRGLAHPAWVQTASMEDLARRFIESVRFGMGESGVRAGVLGELGTSSPVLPEEVKVLRAAARAHFVTGVPINVHCALWRREGPRVLDILQAEGVDLRRVAISHLDELLDYDYHCSLAVRGAWLSLDTFGSEFTFGEEREPTDDERVGHLLRLLRAGWAGQILLSQDVCTKLQLRRFGGKGYLHILTGIVPKLRDSGVGEETIHELLVDNPRRYLTAGR